MTTHQMIRALVDNHSNAATFISNLADDQFATSRNGKWSPGQQLAHLILCLQPISQALASAAYMEEKFGTLQRKGMNYDEVLQVYKTGLENGGKAPDRFLPQVIDSSQRTSLLKDLNDVLAVIQNRLEHYTEQQLNTLVLPHPFLGLLSIRELLYLMSYHPLHHLDQVQHNLNTEN